MAKVTGSVSGNWAGAVGGTVFGKSFDGIHTVRQRPVPTQRGTLKELLAFQAGRIRTFSYKQMNSRNVNRFLGMIVRTHLTTLIDTVWHDFCARHHVKRMSAGNMFVKQNKSILYNSMTNTSLIWNESTNTVDLKKMLVSYGDLEPVDSITSATYTTDTGELVISFSESVFGNGLATDKAYVVVARKPILEAGTYKPSIYIYEPTGGSVARSAATITVTIAEGLTATDLTAYLYFKDVAGVLGYSNSKGHAVVAA
jgi:hypothetical protein